MTRIPHLTNGVLLSWLQDRLNDPCHTTKSIQQLNHLVADEAPSPIDQFKKDDTRHCFLTFQASLEDSTCSSTVLLHH